MCISRSTLTFVIDLSPCGIDWLVKYMACLDYFRKIVTFKVNEANASVLLYGVQKRFNTRLVSALEAKRLMHSNCEGYIAFINEKKPVYQLRSIPVVCEFLDVFPDEMSCLPPTREVNSYLCPVLHQ